MFTKEYTYYIYILSSDTETLYIWVTNDLKRRVYEHKNKLLKWFTEKYIIDRLVYYESYNDVNLALAREKQLKKWKRERKINLINDFNILWEDLYKKLAD